MRLYAGTSKEFLSDNLHNRIADKLTDAFRSYFRYTPPLAEVRSWRESLKCLSQVFQYGGLLDHGVMLEYQLPLTSKRLDCMVTGHDEQMRANAVIVELKQWQQCEATDGDELVSTWLAGASRDVLHPSAQAAQYQQYLADTHTAFHEGESAVSLSACAYLHNYVAKHGDILFDSKFDSLRIDVPIFDGDHVDPLKDYLVERLHAGNGMPVLRKIEESKYRPSKNCLIM